MSTSIASSNSKAKETPSPPEAPSASNAILPADLIAIVMDFSQYSDVRNSLLAGKLMTKKVSTLVREIHIMKPNEMKPQVKTKERFPNVRVVNIFCLFTSEYQYFSSPLSERKFYPTVAACVVPFLSFFPKLKTSFIGGYENHKRIPYSYYDYRYRHLFTSRDHTRHIESLLVALCGALQMGMLPANLDLQGIVADSIYPSYSSFDCKMSGRNSTIDESEPQPCLCRFVHEHFFLQNLVWVNGTGDRRDDQKYCISWEDQIDIMSKRNDSTEFFSSGMPLLVHLRDGYYYEADEFIQWGIDDIEEIHKVYSEVERRGICAGAGRYHLEYEAMERILCLIENFGCNPRALRREHVTNALMKGCGRGYRRNLPRSTKILSGRLMIDKIQYDKLSSWGFDIDQKVFVAVSDEELEIWMTPKKKRRCD